jgi:hypothetical protein
MVQAAQYYNAKAPNLGAEFLHDLKKAVKRLAADPALMGWDSRA